VQSQIISDKLRNFGLKKNLKVLTFAKDVAASGGYLILSCGEHVSADSSSIVGSIGVIFTKIKMRGLLDLASIDNKQYASNKYFLVLLSKLLQNILSPWQDLNDDDRAYLKSLCDNSHTKFIDYVKKQRGNKLKKDERLFTGEVFNGIEAK
jgi:ClpP class serine protease